MNGSGYSTTKGYVTKEGYCPGAPAGCSRKIRDLSIQGGCPACSGQDLQPDSTVAVKPQHVDLDCGDTVCIYQVGIRTVTDKGGGLDEKQLDHFIGLQQCGTTVTDIGNLQTIKIYPVP